MLLQTKYIKIEPAAAAIIMAYGIFFLGAMEYFPQIDAHFGKFGALLLIILWMVIYALLTWQFFQHDFFRLYIDHPVQTFTMGTWIAGVSVFCTVLLKHFPQASALLTVMALFNVFLSCFFLVVCVRNFIRLSKQAYPVDGAILLSTVGMQSIVILMYRVFDGLPISIAFIVIGIASVFYLLSIFYIILFYWKNKWTIRDHWANTNCIIHGALSITGLAWLTVQPVYSHFIHVFWWLTFLFMLLVEFMEIIRLISRLRHYGFEQAIGKYHVSQWSRNFTFGMFFAFTWAFIHAAPPQISMWQQGILAVWVWVVICMLAIETVLWLLAKGRKIVKQRKK